MATLASTSSTSPPRFSQSASQPVTPDNNLRNRWRPAPAEGPSPPPDGASPSSSTTVSSHTATRAPQDPPLSFRSLMQSSNNELIDLTATPSKRTFIRSDPVLLTCFDPADKELYALWAPQR